MLRTVIVAGVAMAGTLLASVAQPGAVQDAGHASVSTGGEPSRIDRTIAVVTQRYDEWLGAAPSLTPRAITVRVPWWSSPGAMHLESQVAVALARTRLASLHGSDTTAALVDGIAWHLQSRVVEELFDIVQRQPGHHIDEVSLFGGHVRWGVPLLVVPRHAWDDRIPLPVIHALEAVASLEGVVGWPALAAAIRVLLSPPAPNGDDEVRARLESALGIPLTWFFALLEARTAVDYSLSGVSTQLQNCDGRRCYQTTAAVTRQGPPIGGGVLIQIDFGGEQRSLLRWTGDEGAREFRFESGLAPVAITIDPGRQIRLDGNFLDQRWRAEPSAASRPFKWLVSWVVWLQHATLTHSVLL